MSMHATTRYKIPDSAMPIDAITQCNYELEDSNKVTMELCENPGLINYGISSQIPVTGKDQTLFRNAYCAKCRGDKDVRNYIYWDLSVNCKETITFNRENILHVLEENACEVYFKPPGANLPMQPCHALPEYKISTCNETGRWVQYNSTIEVACHSFTDPFNETYRNYYCYLCNTDKPTPRDKWSCRNPYEQRSGWEAPVSFIITFDAIKRLQSGVLLNCDPETQFTDLKKLVCRDLRCNDFDYHGVTCQPVFIDYWDYCFVGFVKLTFDRRTLFTEPELNIDELVVAFYRNLTSDLPANSIKDVRIYIKTADHEGKSVIDYLVIQFYINDYIDTFVKSLHGRFCVIGSSNKIAYCEFSLYDPTDNEDQHLYVPNPTDMTSDALRPLKFKKVAMDMGFCDNKPLRVINKLHICVHIELSEDEFEMEIRNTFLTLNVNSKEFTFSHWDYEKFDGGAKLCLEDYLTIYKTNVQLDNDDNLSRLRNCDVGKIPIKATLMALIVNGLCYII